jgi:hypothetical protein
LTLVGKPQWELPFGDLDVNERIILKWNLESYGAM